MDGLKIFYSLGYGNFNAVVSTLGRTPGQKFDPETGKEDFSEQRQVRHFMEEWRPGHTWLPQPICLYFEEKGKKYEKLDRIFGSAIGPFFSEKAVRLVRPILEREGYILPMENANASEEIFLWWVPVVENSVDYSRSVKHSPQGAVRTYVFNDEALRGKIAFRPHYDGMYNPNGQGRVFVSEEFKDAWLDANLTGIEFKPA